MPAPGCCGHAPDARTWDIDTASHHSATDAPPGGVAENQHSEHSGHCLMYNKILLIMEQNIHMDCTAIWAWYDKLKKKTCSVSFISTMKRLT